MTRMSKRMAEAKNKVDQARVYALDQALQLVKDTKKGEQQIRATVSLPHGTGKTKKIAAFVGPNDEKAATEAGADLVYGEPEIKKIKDTGKVEFDIAVATPEMMPKLAAAAKVLGPKGLMPNPKTDTVGADIKKLVSELRRGKAAFKNDDGANIHQVIGKVSFDTTQLKENFNAFMDALKKAKPAGAKGVYIKSVYLASAMGPSVKVGTE